MAGAVWLGLVGCATTPPEERLIVVPKWDRFERAFSSPVEYMNPFQDVEVTLELTSPFGDTHKVYGFWDGGQTWRVRFSPNQVGKWTYETVCSDTANRGLHGQSGSFLCTAPFSRNRFELHGPVRVSRNGHYLEHEDGTPFFWLADTGWNAALLSTPHDWNLYIQKRKNQNFSAIQWVATQWRAAPTGDREGELAYVGRERIQVNPAFFQRLDEKVEALNDAGLLNVPVLLWAISGGSNPEINPGVSLPEDQAILLARYMVARWGANDVVWMLGGDGNYQGDRAERWKKIGRGVFSGISHAPATMHPGGMQWVRDEFADDPWYRIVGYQSGHGDNDATLRWIFDGPPAEEWPEARRPFINLEPPYEYHVAYHSKTRHTPSSVRRAIYWSLLNAPTAGVSYGGHGVWGWDDGTRPPTDHPNSGVPLPLGNAVEMPGAEQMAFLHNFFTSIPFWELRPAPEMLAVQPGVEDPARHISASRTVDGSVAVVYVPVDRTVDLLLDSLPPKFAATWFDPRTGHALKVVAVVNEKAIQFATPTEGDWVLLLETEGD